jgi:hypothetical protein
MCIVSAVLSRRYLPLNGQYLSSPFQVEIAIANLNKYKSPGCYRIPAELIQAGCETLLSLIHKIINSIWSKEKLADKLKEPIILSIYENSDKTD